jgi:glycosyltransferase involved in cell wall biosynthesis
MWAFCGAEHYTDEYRWKYGYQRNNRPVYESGFDLNFWTWKRKIKNWKKPIHIIAPSYWLGNCVKESKLMHEWPIEVIPYPIDTNFWKPLKKNLARELLDLPKDVPLVLFGAVGGGYDPRKGFDLLLDSLKLLNDDQRAKNLELVVFGQREPKVLPKINFPIHYNGYLHDDIFKSLTVLKKINLENIKLKIISDDLLKPLTMLQVLNISYNNLTTISNVIFYRYLNLDIY